MNKALNFIIFLFLVISLCGCFNTDRNNPFDPNADLPDSERIVILKGYTMRGYTDQPLTNVRVTVGGKETYSDNNGFYQIEINPGIYNLRAEKNGWASEQYAINIKQDTVEYINLLIWYDYFEGYSGPPTSPWTVIGSGIADVNVNGLQMYVNTTPNDIWVELYSYPNDTTPLYNVMIGITFNSGWATSTAEGFSIEHNATSLITLTGAFAGILELTTGGGGFHTLDVMSNIMNDFIIVEIMANPGNLQTGRVYFYDYNGDWLFNENGYIVNFGDNFELDILRFFVHDAGAAGTTTGNITIHFVEFY